MKRNNNYLIFGILSLLVVPYANAAGTYYNGDYQSPQQRYNNNANGYAGATYADQQNSYNNYYYQRYQQPQYQQDQSQQTQQRRLSAGSGVKEGFYLDGGISREAAMWNFEMKEANSILHYDNISWNVFDVNGGYNFDIGNTAAQVDVGVKIGTQSGDSTMVDDDVTKGGYFITQWVDSVSGDIMGDQIGHALSVGTSSGGSMFGYNVGFGLTDFFKWGNTKITPSIGYRSLSYKLETNKNFGLSVDTANCFKVSTGEIQCDPAFVTVNSTGGKTILWRDNITDTWQIDPDAETVDTGGTYFYQQPGTSHSYEVTWAGPYAALDMLYTINQYNSIDGRVELGLPGYTSTGNQPYRFDWQHPKSVEDSAGIGSAMHLGLGANWKTSLTDSVMLSFGLTYDYYSVTGADAKTYLSSEYYLGMYDALLADWIAAGGTEASMLNPTTGSEAALGIKALQTACPGWVCNANSEVDSFYKSMGIRVGLSAKF